MIVVVWFAVVAGLTVVSLLPQDTSPVALGESTAGVVSSLAHIPAYALLVALSVPVARRLLRARRAALALASCFGLALGLVMEIVQPFFGRSGNLLDMSYNIAGVVLGAGYWLRRRPLAPRRVRRALARQG